MTPNEATNFNKNIHLKNIIINEIDKFSALLKNNKIKLILSFDDGEKLSIFYKYFNIKTNNINILNSSFSYQPYIETQEQFLNRIKASILEYITEIEAG